MAKASDTCSEESEIGKKQSVAILHLLRSKRAIHVQSVDLFEVGSEATFWKLVLRFGWTASSQPEVMNLSARCRPAWCHQNCLQRLQFRRTTLIPVARHMGTLGKGQCGR